MTAESAVETPTRSMGSATKPDSGPTCLEVPPVLAAPADEQLNQAQDDKEYAEPTECSLGGWRPAWIQPLASKKAFLVVQGLIGLLIMAINSYFIGTLTTIEKRFHVPSATAGVIASATDAGYMISLLTLGYVGSRGRIPRYIAGGALAVGLCCFVFVVPHVLFGAGADARALATDFESLAHDAYANASNSGLRLCGDVSAKECEPERGSFGVPVMFFVGANFFMGAGGAMYFTLSVAYLDGNTRKNKAPLVLALSLVIRMMGPSAGFAMASYALAHYVDPSSIPTITNSDPRWIGAWWMGYVVFGVALCLLAPAMAFFPRKLPRAARHRALAGRTAMAPPRKSFRDFRSLIGRLVRNRLFMLNTFSTIFFVFGFSGLWNFMPKYMETLFRQTASRASFLIGSVGLVFSALGVLTSGVVITHYRPRPRTLAAWNVFTEVTDVFGYGSWAFLGCPADRLHGSPAVDGSWNLTTTCNTGCNCGYDKKYAPVCLTETFMTFYSPCHAGCSQMEIVNQKRTFRDCSCALEKEVIDGACTADCSSNFTVFLVMQSILRFLQATGKSGNMLIQFRSVNEDDKPMSVAFTEFLMCGLVYIPAPIIYGIIVDSVCLVWSETCGQSGNCWLYNGHLLRYAMNFSAASCLTCGLLLDIGVWYFAKDLHIYDNDNSVTGLAEMEKKETKEEDIELHNIL